jgi:hypothetical protein
MLEKYYKQQPEFYCEFIDRKHPKELKVLGRSIRSSPDGFGETVQRAVPGEKRRIFYFTSKQEAAK